MDHFAKDHGNHTSENMSQINSDLSKIKNALIVLASGDSDMLDKVKEALNPKPVINRDTVAVSMFMGVSCYDELSRLQKHTVDTAMKIRS
jgi:hypothetical protein